MTADSNSKHGHVSDVPRTVSLSSDQLKELRQQQSDEEVAKDLFESFKELSAIAKEKSRPDETVVSDFHASVRDQT